jgi:pyruvate/2-oxoglutarate/acetoin dehydrogenase E1 component
MMLAERVAENLNRALHRLFDTDPRAYLLGEDVLDPYGGAFKITKGLSARFGDRVLGTPISEGGIVGVGGGLALAGDTAVVEIMFADFITLGFDQIVNFASKSVSMYGRRLPMRLIVRCASGGNRGYGPTHSQSPQKHFIGVPHLGLYELSPFHDGAEVFDAMLATGEPAILFEDKILYTRRVYRDGVVDDLFAYDFLDEERNYARAYIDSPDSYDCVVLAPGGLTDRVLAAARELFLKHEVSCQVIVPSRLYPFDPAPLLDTLAAAQRVVVVEESVAGGTWGAEVAQQLYPLLWGRLRHPIVLVNSADSIIPTAAHLEREVLVQDTTIYRAVREAVGV